MLLSHWITCVGILILAILLAILQVLIIGGLGPVSFVDENGNFLGYQIIGLAMYVIALLGIMVGINAALEVFMAFLLNQFLSIVFGWLIFCGIIWYITTQLDSFPLTGMILYQIVFTAILVLRLKWLKGKMKFRALRSPELLDDMTFRE